MPAGRAERIDLGRVRLAHQAARARQTAADADWLIGAGLFTARVNGSRPALDEGARHGVRRPGSRQGSAAGPHGRATYTTYLDNGGVHINSGIPNQAFYQAAVDIGGFAWEKAGRIWYETLRDSALRENTGFKRFANLTVATAMRLYGPGSAEAEVVVHAWATVGLGVASPPAWTRGQTPVVQLHTSQADVGG